MLSRLIRRGWSFLLRLRWWCYVRILNWQQGVQIGRIVVFGEPQISVCAGGVLEVEDGVILRSSNSGYHVNLFAPVKVQVSYPGAIIKIGVRSRVYGSSLNAYNSIEIGQDCLIAGNCQIMDANGHIPYFDCLEKRAASKDKGKPVVLEDHVWLGTGCIVLPGVRIGRGSIVGAGSVVARDIPPMCVAAGNPAVVIRQYNAQGARMPMAKETP